MGCAFRSSGVLGGSEEDVGAWVGLGEYIRFCVLEVVFLEDG